MEKLKEGDSDSASELFQVGILFYVFDLFSCSRLTFPMDALD